jgi:hypothetical protein
MGDRMQEHEKTFLELLAMGALIGIAKLLVSSEALTLRLILGRAVLGSATSTVAGVVLVQIPDLDPLALIALGSAFGIVGSQYIELLLKRRAKSVIGGNGEEV